MENSIGNCSSLMNSLDMRNDTGPIANGSYRDEIIVGLPPANNQGNVYLGFNSGTSVAPNWKMALLPALLLIVPRLFDTLICKVRQMKQCHN